MFGMEPQDAGASSRVAISELLKTGVTTVTDLSINRESWLDDLASTGIRAVVCPMYRSRLLVHEERPRSGLRLGREGGRSGLRGSVADHRRRRAAPERPALRHDGAGADRHLHRGPVPGQPGRGAAPQHSAADPCRQAIVEFHEMMRRHGKTPIEWLDQTRRARAGPRSSATASSSTTIRRYTGRTATISPACATPALPSRTARRCSRAAASRSTPSAAT